MKQISSLSNIPWIVYEGFLSLKMAMTQDEFHVTYSKEEVWFSQISHTTVSKLVSKSILNV